jgi:hypothetical protein
MLMKAVQMAAAKPRSPPANARAGSTNDQGTQSFVYAPWRQYRWPLFARRLKTGHDKLLESESAAQFELCLKAEMFAKFSKSRAFVVKLDGKAILGLA